MKRLYKIIIEKDLSKLESRINEVIRNIKSYEGSEQLYVKEVFISEEGSCSSACVYDGEVSSGFYTAEVFVSREGF